MSYRMVFDAVIDHRERSKSEVPGWFMNTPMYITRDPFLELLIDATLSTFSKTGKRKLI